jgi:hypothetical protein
MSFTISESVSPEQLAALEALMDSQSAREGGWAHE